MAKARLLTGKHRTHTDEGTYTHLPGDVLEVTEDELAAFGDKFELIPEPEEPAEEEKPKPKRKTRKKKVAAKTDEAEAASSK